MAGSDPTTETDIQLIDVETLMHRFESSNDLLREIADNTRAANRARTVIPLFVTAGTLTNIYREHTRTFVETIIIAATTIAAGATLILLVGSIRHRFRLAGTSPIIIPFPIVIDRGIDVQGEFSATVAEGDIYIIGTVE